MDAGVFAMRTTFRLFTLLTALLLGAMLLTPALQALLRPRVRKEIRLESIL